MTTVGIAGCTELGRGSSGPRLRGAETPDGRFIFYWIAFNSMYGQAEYLTEDRQREEARIHEFPGGSGESLAELLEHLAGAMRFYKEQART